MMKPVFLVGLVACVLPFVVAIWNPSCVQDFHGTCISTKTQGCMGIISEKNVISDCTGKTPYCCVVHETKGELIFDGKCSDFGGKCIYYKNHCVENSGAWGLGCSDDTFCCTQTVEGVDVPSVQGPASQTICEGDGTSVCASSSDCSMSLGNLVEMDGCTGSDICCSFAPDAGANVVTQDCASYGGTCTDSDSCDGVGGTGLGCTGATDFCCVANEKAICEGDGTSICASSSDCTMSLGNLVEMDGCTGSDICCSFAPASGANVGTLDCASYGGTCTDSDSCNGVGGTGLGCTGATDFCCVANEEVEKTKEEPTQSVCEANGLKCVNAAKECTNGIIVQSEYPCAASSNLICCADMGKCDNGQVNGKCVDVTDTCPGGRLSQIPQCAKESPATPYCCLPPGL